MLEVIRTRTRLERLAIILAFVLLAVPAFAQKNKKYKPTESPRGSAVMWEQVDVGERDLYLGPGGKEMAPDLSRIKFIKKGTGGTQKKYHIEDGSGRIWVAKIGREARPETAAVRL